METEKELVSLAQKDIKNFDKIYATYSERIRNYLRPRVNNDSHIADDLTSQTFEKALKNIKKFKWQGASFTSWLYTIANNTLIDYYRKNKKEVDLEPDHFKNINDETIELEDLIIQMDTNSRLKKSLNKLPEREKKAILLKFYEGQSNKEIAKELSLSETNVGTIIYRATKKLKEIIREASLDGNI